MEDNFNNKKRIPYLKIILIGTLFILIQSFLQQYDKVSEVFKQYIGYFTPFLYALFTAIFLEPIVSKVENRFSVKRWIAVLITVTIFLIVLVVFIWSVIPQIIQSCRDLYDKIPIIQSRINELLGRIFQFLNEKNIDLIGQDEMQQSILSFFRRNLGKFRDFGFSFVLNMFWWSFAITKFFIGFFLGTLILLDKDYFIRIIRNLLKIVFGGKRSMVLLEFINTSRLSLLSYLWGRVIASVFVAGLVLMIALIAKIPYAFLSSIMILIGNMIPYVGSILAGAISIFLVFVSEPNKVVWMFAAICLAQACDAWFIGPKIVSQTMGIKTFWVIFSILIGGSLFGPVGMFFGVPVLCVVRLIYHSFLSKREKNEDGNIL